MKVNLKQGGWVLAALLPLTGFAQVEFTAASNATVRSDGPTTSPWFHNAQTPGDFESYGVSSFLVTPSDLGVEELDGIEALTISYTQSNAGFTTDGLVTLFITFDETVSGGDYSGLTHNGTVVAVDDTQFSDNPTTQVVGTGTFTETESGAVDTYELDISAVEETLLEAINAGTPFSLIIAATGNAGAVTYAGIENNSYPGSIVLTLTPGTSDSPATLPWEGVGLGESGDSPWFGRFQGGTDDWILHQEIGWVYTGNVTSTGNMWLYSLVRESWIWTNEDTFPVLYDSSSSSWLLIVVISDAATLIYDYGTGRWSLVP